MMQCVAKRVWVLSLFSLAFFSPAIAMNSDERALIPIPPAQNPVSIRITANSEHMLEDGKTEMYIYDIPPGGRAGLPYVKKATHIFPLVGEKNKEENLNQALHMLMEDCLARVKAEAQEAKSLIPAAPGKTPKSRLTLVFSGQQDDCRIKDFCPPTSSLMHVVIDRFCCNYQDLSINPMHNGRLDMRGVHLQEFLINLARQMKAGAELEMRDLPFIILMDKEKATESEDEKQRRKDVEKLNPFVAFKNAKDMFTAYRNIFHNQEAGKGTLTRGYIDDVKARKEDAVRLEAELAHPFDPNISASRQFLQKTWCMYIMQCACMDKLFPQMCEFLYSNGFTCSAFEAVMEYPTPQTFSRILRIRATRNAMEPRDFAFPETLQQRLAALLSPELRAVHEGKRQRQP